MKKKLNINVILIGAVMLLALVMYVKGDAGKIKGGSAMVLINKTDKRMEISLQEDKIHTITDGNIKVTLEVKDGRIRFINSLCPDHLCEGYGFISMEDDSAICMPAGVAVIIAQEVKSDN